MNAFDFIQRHYTAKYRHQEVKVEISNYLIVYQNLSSLKGKKNMLRHLRTFNWFLTFSNSIANHLLVKFVGIDYYLLVVEPVDNNVGFRF